MKKTKTATAQKKRFAFPTGREVYDRIIVKIEPELVTANLKKLDAPYKKETKAARKKRYARYAKALKQYRKEYNAWIARLRMAVSAYKKAVTRAVEKMNKTKEDDALKALEAQMFAA